MPKTGYAPTGTPDVDVFEDMIKQGIKNAMQSPQLPQIVGASVIDDVSGNCRRAQDGGQGASVPDPTVANQKL